MRKRTLSLIIASVLTLPGLALADSDTDKLRQEIDALKLQNKMILERLDATADMLESGQAGSDQGGHGQAANGTLRARAFRRYSGKDKTTLGGYGELHYNNLSNSKVGGTDKKQMDLHRFIMFFGHEFDKNTRFWSELEVEHAVVEDTSDGSSKGEVAIEQAFLEFDLGANHMVRAGILLVPVGIINETHEPPTFYGVERNNVESKIIPTTWSEGGVSFTGRLADAVSYDLALHTGLQTSATTNYAVRSGRKDVSNAPANDLAMTARLKWTGIPGLEIGGAIQRQSDMTQGTDSTAGAGTLLEGHVVWQTGKFGLRALYATWNLDGAGPAAVGADEQTGWYVEPAWKFTPKLGMFARVSNWDNQVNSGSDTQYDQVDVGFNFWPHEDVVIKVDYQDQSAPIGKNEYDGFNVGVGYQF